MRPPFPLARIVGSIIYVRRGKREEEWQVTGEMFDRKARICGVGAGIAVRGSCWPDLHRVRLDKMQKGDGMIWGESHRSR